MRLSTGSFVAPPFFLPDRKALFRLIEGVNYRFEPVKKYQTKAEKAGEVEEDRTYSLIDNFLANLPEEKPPPSETGGCLYRLYGISDAERRRSPIRLRQCPACSIRN